MYPDRMLFKAKANVRTAAGSELNPWLLFARAIFRQSGIGQNGPRIRLIVPAHLQLQRTKARLKNPRILTRKKSLNPRRLQPQPSHLRFKRFRKMRNSNNV